MVYGGFNMNIWVKIQIRRMIAPKRALHQLCIVITL